ncbi:B12-binding domain-containing radical SAM protein [Chloroflexota bacterium]
MLNPQVKSKISSGSHPRRLWLDLGDLSHFMRSVGPLEQLQDHGIGLLRTIMHQEGLLTDIASIRAVPYWWRVRRQLKGYGQLFMNVRSYTYPIARRSAQIFKELNPDGIVIVGGMHATVALDEMEGVPEFDHIVQGPGENIIVDIARDPSAFPRVVQGVASRTMGDWPMIDRTLWPKVGRHSLAKNPHWPLEPACGWGPPPVATMLTSRVCPWKCVFCNESSYIPNMGRRPVDMVIEELNYLDEHYGPLGSVVIHDSMFFQNPSWLKEWIEKYPRKTNKAWSYWAAGRSDTVRQWPDLFEALLKETNWDTVSIGFESGSDRILRMLNKECTEEDNYFAIDMINRIGDELEAQGRKAPIIWANVMLGIPGETQEDAFKTMRMVKSMRRAMPSIAFYAPYPGSALGYQLIAEGKSNMSKENYHRYPTDEKLKGIDYQFYRELLAGKYDDEVNKGLDPLAKRKAGDYSAALIKA